MRPSVCPPSLHSLAAVVQEPEPHGNTAHRSKQNVLFQLAPLISFHLFIFFSNVATGKNVNEPRGLR